MRVWQVSVLWGVRMPCYWQSAVGGVFVAVCNFVVHDRCLNTVVSPCSSVATNLIKVAAAQTLHFL